ncbi:MAG: polysaccharide pyruvyl transferase family protein [Balneolaceae bacterium]|nr:polysaccharide pyruvyl transferase family protein [Balneolaceae bacterium]
MKSVGTITFHNSINYGAILQAYALQKTLKNMGYFSEIIDYCNSRRGLSSLSRFQLIRYFMWHEVVKRILVGSERQKRTEDFCRKYFRKSAQKYLDAETLHSAPPLYDAYITGSDQVWNPRNNSKDSCYFLTFAPSGRRRISYAASFGISQLPDIFVNDYQKWLKQIHFLSTREVEGKLIIKRHTGRTAEVVLDPTLLLDQDHWRSIAVPYEFIRPYILCYYMPGDTAVNKCITEMARQLSDKMGWQVICLGQKEYVRLLPWKKSVFDAGPAEFLGLFQNASFVITNSFHGTAFAINYRKPFLVPINRELTPEKTLSSRITTLLKTLKLENRLFPVGKERKITGIKNVLDLDYHSVEVSLQEEKQRSFDFLKNALGEA